MDITADPCDDFYRFACGGWMEENVIPDGRNKWGRFYELRGAVDDDLKGKARECEPENIYHLFNIEILQTLEIVTSEENEGKPASVIKLRNMFSSCMDTDTMEADGIPQQLLHAAAWELGGWPAVIDNWGPEK